MALMIDKHPYRRYLLTYEQARTVLFALAATSGMLYTSQDPQLQELRRDCQKLHEELRSYRWYRHVSP